MQRDVYAAMIKKKHKEMLPINILQLSGQVTFEHIFDEVFDGHRLRRIVLMTNMAGVDSAKGPKLPQDIVVTNFATLKAVHQPHFQYKLLPLLCEGVVAFQALQAICSCAGSPFVIDHRRDTVPLRFSFPPLSPFRGFVAEALHHETREEERLRPVAQRKLPIPSYGVMFDGILVNTSNRAVDGGHMGFMNLVDSVTPQIVEEHANMYKIIDGVARTRGLITASVPMHYDYLSVRHKYRFLVSKRPIATSEVVPLAKRHGFHLYEGKGDSFVYLQ